MLHLIAITLFVVAMLVPAFTASSGRLVGLLFGAAAHWGFILLVLLAVTANNEESQFGGLIPILWFFVGWIFSLAYSAILRAMVGWFKGKTAAKTNPN